MRSFITCNLHSPSIIKNDQVKEDEMGTSYGRHRKEEDCI
jgi:hypothetical protein